MKHGCVCLLMGLVLAASVLLTGCAQAPLDYPRIASWSLTSPEQTRMAGELAPQLADLSKEGFVKVFRFSPTDKVETRRSG